MMTNDSLMVVCGGGAYRMIEESTLDLPIQTIFLKHDAGHVDKEEDTIMVSDMGTIGETIETIDSMMEDMRVVVILSVLGGASSNVISSVMDRARRHGSKVVVILGLPMKFEHERRKLADECLKPLVDKADKAFIVDIETINVYDEDVMFKDVLQYNAYVLMYAVNVLTSFLSGPFFSTFPEKAYTISFSAGLNPKGTVKHAVLSSMFQRRSDNDQAIIMVGSSTGPDFLFNLTSELIAETGMLPDVVKRGDQDSSFVLFFFPIII